MAWFTKGATLYVLYAAGSGFSFHQHNMINGVLLLPQWAPPSGGPTDRNRVRRRSGGGRGRGDPVAGSDTERTSGLEDCVPGRRPWGRLRWAGAVRHSATGRAQVGRGAERGFHRTKCVGKAVGHIELVGPAASERFPASVRPPPPTTLEQAPLNQRPQEEGNDHWQSEFVGGQTAGEENTAGGLQRPR
ncbi:hypothetical protein NDU88_003007 [Pleurodeles waltl]|uniref:Uncharacterized protein n=1 Tax=Pleurodeles waltl TaxID=8319 RepID=A0AAV7M294_PLEWA|nr:hypothetical protein NDU88_003007 [Pleurodeles waltl]